MFTIKARFEDSLTINASPVAVHDFFVDLGNFERLMPGIDSISVDADGVSKWIVAAEIPVVGAIRQEFLLRVEEDSDERIEFGPADADAGNLLRFFAELAENSDGTTAIKFVQNVELRRKEAKEFHFLAGMAGEALISSELTKSVSKMTKTFIARSKAELESSPA